MKYSGNEGKKNVMRENVKESVKISVIIPVHNTEKYLSRCLESITSQTYKNLEIICINDGSTDHSLDILEFYSHRDRRIKVLSQEASGPSSARNKGLQMATGKYISFVDSDDFVSWNGYEILSLVAEKNNLDLVIFGGNSFPEDKRISWVDEVLDTKYKLYDKKDGYDVLFHEKSSRPFLWLHFIKRDVLENPSSIRFDESMMLGEDQLFQFEYLPRVKKAMVIEDKIYNYRIARGGSLMQLYSARKIQKIETHLILVQKIIDAWKEAGFYEEAKDKLITWIVNFLYYSIMDLPVSYKQIYAEKILKIIQQSNIEIWLMAEYEQELFKRLQELSLTQVDEYTEIERLSLKIEQEEYEISETLKSRAFKLGRFLTSKKDRLDLSKFVV